MDLVRRLGLRFLWVDSLCIVQDSARSWNLNSKMMNLIYGNACLTICAADGFDASTGLKAADALRPSVAQHIEECAPGVSLMVSQLAETGIGVSIWNTRAWTFQERMLSKRCLIFTEGRVFYQCRSATMSEDLVSESHGIGWSLDLAKALPQVLNDLKGRPIRVYMNCVSQYSTRKLTQPRDILAAFNGVSNLIGQHMQAPFIFGLPSSHFDLALLWEPLKAVTRRVEQEKEDFKGLVFPSWSWCGWRGEPVSYRNSQIEGCLTNVSEWLTKHTWIAWYIRDGRGNLRPIWHGQKSRVSGHVEDRWKGYKNHPADRDYERFQVNASQNLGRTYENDLNNWAKEEELARIQKIPKLPLVPPPAPGQAIIIRRGDGNPYDSYERAQSPHRRELEREVVRERPRERYYYEEDARGFSDDVDGPRVSHHHRHQSPELEVPNEELKTRAFNDEYGRDLSQEMAQKPRKAFQQCLPENPSESSWRNISLSLTKTFRINPFSSSGHGMLLSALQSHIARSWNLKGSVYSISQMTLVTGVVLYFLIRTGSRRRGRTAIKSKDQSATFWPYRTPEHSRRRSVMFGTIMSLRNKIIQSGISITFC